jgi:hypothetical protein
MTECITARPAPLRCPTADEILTSALQLLPQGRAWQSNEGGPPIGQTIGFDPGGFDPDGFSATYKKPSILRQFWKAVAGVFSFTNDRLCALRLEFWCATHVETDDLWMAEYGLPDACDPFPDLCTKVAAIGGTRCEYYAEVAARAGWSITCEDGFVVCGTKVGSASSKAGRASPGRRTGAILKILVDLNNSSAWSGLSRAPAMAGKLKAGRGLSCGPNLSPLECILARVVHAEIQIQYEAS